MQINFSRGTKAKKYLGRRLVSEQNKEVTFCPLMPFPHCMAARHCLGSLAITKVPKIRKRAKEID